MEFGKDEQESQKRKREEENDLDAEMGASTTVSMAAPVRDIR